LKEVILFGLSDYRLFQFSNIASCKTLRIENFHLLLKIKANQNVLEIVHRKQSNFSKQSKVRRIKNSLKFSPESFFVHVGISQQIIKAKKSFF
jgi:hypothetical protein